MSVKSFIIVRTRFEGFHFWKEAPIEVDFLKLLHRHMFYVEAKIPVMDNDRQLEFFIVKRFIDSVIKNNFPNGEIRGKSCEMIAEIILEEIQSKYALRKGVSVYVFEDNENGGGCES